MATIESGEKRRTLDCKDELVRIKISNSNEAPKYGGYKKELLIQKLTLMETNFLVCGRCCGVLFNAVSANAGLLQLCESCINEGETYQAIGPARSTIFQISATCPLSERGCEWMGNFAEIFNHLDECTQFMIECPYVEYGCKIIIKRGENGDHRTNNKDYHTELVSVFMAEKIKTLEAEKREQAEVIKNLESFLKWTKTKDTIWNIEFDQIDSMINEINGTGGGIARNKWWNDKSYYSSTMYTIYGGYTAQLYLHFPDAANAQLHYVVVYGPGADYGFHLGTVEGKAVTTIICQTDESNSTKYEQGGLVQKLGEAALIATIPVEVLRNQNNIKDNIIKLNVEFQD